jgi:hypothetical protein
MAKQMYHNQEFIDGVCVSEEWVEVEVPDPVDPALTEFVSSLTAEQQAALKQALGL